MENKLHKGATQRPMMVVVAGSFTPPSMSLVIDSIPHVAFSFYTLTATATLVCTAAAFASSISANDASTIHFFLVTT